MKVLFMILLIIILFIPSQAQNSCPVNEFNFLFYVSGVLNYNGNRIDLGVGFPLYNDNFYYGLYLINHPGLRLEYRAWERMVMGISIRDNKGIYYWVYHHGVKVSKNFRISYVISPRQDFGIELVFSYR